MVPPTHNLVNDDSLETLHESRFILLGRVALGLLLHPDLPLPSPSEYVQLIVLS